MTLSPGFTSSDVVSYLRLDAGRHPDDPLLTALVGELSLKSQDFREQWARHHVRDKTMITFTVAEDSPSHDVLRLLTRLAADG